MQTSILETKQKVERAKAKYIESCSIISSLKEGDTKNKAIQIRDDAEKLYRYEISQANTLYNMYNKKHNTMLAKMKSNEESRIVFIKDCMNKFNKCLVEIEQATHELQGEIKKHVDAINIENDIDIIMKKDLHFSLYGERFQKEEFEPYKEKRQGQVNAQTNINQVNSVIEEATDFTTLFINGLFGEKEVDVENIGKVMELLYMNLEYSKEFIDYFFSKKSDFYIFTNLNNMQHLANIFNAISFNFEKQRDTFDINFAIIFIAEKTYCIINEKKEKIFLCALLSQNKFYISKQFWTNLIEFKLARKLEERLTHLLKIDIVKVNDNEQKQNFFAKNFFSIKNAIKGAIKKDSNQQKSLLEEVQLSKKIKNYRSLPDYKKPYLDQFASNEIHLIIKEFIIHLCNFNFSSTNAIDLIIEISTKYKLPNEKLNFYVANIDSWTHSVKRYLLNDDRDFGLMDKIQNIKQKRFDLIDVKYPISNIESMKNEQKKIIAILISKYLPLDNSVSLITMNKFILKSARMKIFKSLLSKENIPLKHRLALWKCILNISAIQKTYDYNSLVEKSKKENALPSTITGLIKMDVKRTSFAKNEPEMKAMLTSVLNAIALAKPTINYCQGMNFISSFLLQLTNDEKETFYFMMGIIDNTEFASMFIEDLSKLKSFFFLFERLIAIYIPEAFYALKSANVNVNTFSPAWFITLFTNACTIVDINDPPKVVLKIWDVFFLKGWKGLIATGLVIIKRFQERIKVLKYDEILHFLLSVVIKSDFFKNEKYDLFISSFKEIKITKKMVADLETEYTFELKENTIK